MCSLCWWDGGKCLGCGHWLALFGAGGNVYTGPLIRHGFAVPPSPEGEGFGAVELGRCGGKPTGAAGACPRPTKGTFPLLKQLSCSEPGDPLRWWSITRVAGSPLTAAARRLPLSVGFAASSPRGRAKWERWNSIGAVVDRGSLPLIRHGFAVPPSPEMPINS